jgi:phthiocerol/phenolphthiocerol synthesis type-I polyketide synthase E
MSDREVNEHEGEVAVVGMAARLPGAQTLDEFWRNLRDGVESITFFTPEELAAVGVSPESLRAPNFVRAAPVLRDFDRFDAAFFGYSPREAALLDPQQRIFLECAWEALESAGYRPDGCEGLVGVYAGMSMSSYLLFNLLTNPRLNLAEESFQLMIGTDKDFLSTRVSYHLNLKGPSLDVQTGCSTSLVATHLACEALLSYQCDMALAGGISIQVPQRWGYFHEEGGLASPDGHCRAFDAEARGTLFGSGTGIVVLKRMADAVAQRDTILAVIKGSAINNDGAVKVGFTAPGAQGQAEVIARALAIAGVEPETLGYVEAHGTGTALGDPLEVSALAKAFGPEVPRGSCGLGSVKTNLGHLDAAAGVAGLIKTILALRHGQIPPSLHFRKPNPRLALSETPFYVPTDLLPWRRGAMPRRAAVSSFGIGGTNAHVVLEEAPPPAPAEEESRLQILPLSARTEDELERESAALRERLAEPEGLSLADVAYTLQVGRKRFPCRRVVLGRGFEEARARLGGLEPAGVWQGRDEADDRPVAFLFPGGGTQYPGMGAGLYREEPIFRTEIDRCAGLLQGDLGFDARDLLYPTPDRAGEAEWRMKRTALALPCLFSVEYALARLLMSWGLRPQALVGHSLGEYVAACLAGVFRLEDALLLVAFRGRLLEQIPSGAMLGVPLPEQEVRALMAEAGATLALAAVNGPAQCVVSGPLAEVEVLAALLEEEDVEFRRVQIDVASHSPLVEPILEPFLRFLDRLELRPPQIPFLSNLSGTWATAEEVIRPAYWVRHLRNTVRFGDSVRELLAEPDWALVEVGPGRTLTTLAQGIAGARSGRVILPTLRHAQDRTPDGELLNGTLGRLWLAGLRIDWAALHPEPRRRVPLPTYPFSRQRFWIDPASPAARPAAGKTPDVAAWFYLPCWKPALPPPSPPGALAALGPVLALAADGALPPLAAALLEGLTDAGTAVTVARPGEEVDLRTLLARLDAEGRFPGAVLHLRNLGAPVEDRDGTFFSLLHLAQALGERGAGRPCRLLVVSDRLHRVDGGDDPLPERALLLGPCKVIPQEYPESQAQSIDVPPAVAAGPGARRLAGWILAELAAERPDPVVAYRNGRRWLQGFEPVPLPAGGGVRHLRPQGVYVLTGGLGGVGLLVARELARSVAARLVLVTRTASPEQDAGKLQNLEALGAEVLIATADVADQEQMKAVFDRAQERFGAIHGVFHLAGYSGEQTVKLIPEVDRAEAERHFRAKVDGTRVLARLLDGRALDFCLLFSSNAAVLGGLGAVAYTAANRFLDAFADARPAGGTPWISVSWDGWQLAAGALLGSFQSSLDRYSMTPAEGLEALCRVVEQVPEGRVVVSTGDLRARLAESAGEEPEEAGGAPPARVSRGASCAAPTNEIEARVAAVWSSLLGLDEIGIDDNFFDLGGSSLIGLRVVSRLKRELDIEIPMVKLFEGPTVRSFARLLAAAEAPAGTALADSSDRGARRRAQRPVAAEEAALREHA